MQVPKFVLGETSKDVLDIFLEKLVDSKEHLIDWTKTCEKEYS